MPDPKTDRATLDRIRNNQRRSRARKKEHVIELENRIRLYELESISISVDIQEAARKVDEENKRIDEENKRLRSILHRNGFSDNYIWKSIQIDEDSQNERDQFAKSAPEARTEASNALQRALQPRKLSSVGHPLSYPIPEEIEEPRTDMLGQPMISIQATDNYVSPPNAYFPPPAPPGGQALPPPLAPTAARIQYQLTPDVNMDTEPFPGMHWSQQPNFEPKFRFP